MKLEVFARLQFEGLHQWANCDIDEVDYLRSLHRHVFHIEARKEVSHDDRDTEFIVLKHRIQEYIDETYPIIDKKRILGSTSCEMLAIELINKFNLTSCIVSEDGENGAIVTV